MKSPSAAELETAKRLLAHESGDETHPATSAARAYKKLHDRLAPLIGSAGVRAIFVRSLKSGRLVGFVFPEGATAAQSASPEKQPPDDMTSQEPAQAAEAAAVVLATFFGLLTTFIGDKLTRQVLRGAWPEMIEATSAEMKK